ASNAEIPALFAAILVSVFFTTAYVACSLIDCRRVFSCATVSPRYSVSRMAFELPNFSVSSATDASLFAMDGLLVIDAETMKKAPAQAHGAAHHLDGNFTHLRWDLRPCGDQRSS